MDQVNNSKLQKNSNLIYFKNLNIFSQGLIVGLIIVVIIVFFDLLYGTFFGTPYEAGLHNLVVGIAFFIIIFVSIYQAYRLQDVPFDEKKKIKTSLKLFFSRVMIFFLFIMIMAMILSIYFQNTIIERLIKLSLINLGALMFVLGPIILVLGPIFILLIFIIANAISSFFIKNLGEILIKEKNISVQEAFTELTPVREQKFSSEEYSVRGFIDAVHHCGDEIHILDYKTNARFDMKESIKLQLAIYSLLYQEKKGVMPHKVGIFFLRHKSKYMNVEPGLIELAKREINSIHSHTSSTEHVDDYPQTITPLCKWSTGQCDYYHACKPHG